MHSSSGNTPQTEQSRADFTACRGTLIPAAWMNPLGSMYSFTILTQTNLLSLLFAIIFQDDCRGVSVLFTV